ncbi:MAG TPA: hypothetical protein VGL99_21265 [Chloroflexota bacterium]|jgi:hypothetical protein
MISEIDVATSAVSSTLSVEEVLVVLKTLDRASIYGLNSQAWVDSPPREQEVSLAVAQRGLIARGLAQVDANRQLLVHRALLMAVGVCAFPQWTAYVDHWPSQNVAPVRLYIHRRGAECVVHRPIDDLHRFDLLGSEADLADYLSATLGWPDASASGPELHMSRADFQKACEVSATGDRAATAQLLGGANSTDNAAALTLMLTGTPRVSILQTIGAGTDSRPDTEGTFTVLEGGGDGWLVAPLARGANTPLVATPCSRERLRSALRDLM